MSSEFEYPHSENGIINDWVEYASIRMPRFLITKESLEKKMAKSKAILAEVREEFEKGTSTEDAGDTHGQYHNEYEWYRQQSLQMRELIGRKIGQNLDLAVVISDYDEVRENLKKLGVDPGRIATISSKVGVLYPEETDPEEIILVSVLDSGGRPEWVSVESPLGLALMGHKEGDNVVYKLARQNQKPLEIPVKIASLS
jgi:hypothetical protein